MNIIRPADIRGHYARPQPSWPFTGASRIADYRQVLVSRTGQATPAGRPPSRQRGRICFTISAADATLMMRFFFFFFSAVFSMPPFSRFRCLLLVAFSAVFRYFDILCSFLFLSPDVFLFRCRRRILMCHRRGRQILRQPPAAPMPACFR